MIMDLDLDIPSSSLNLPTPLVLAASLITTAILLLARTIITAFLPFIHSFALRGSASNILGVCAGTVLVLISPCPTSVSQTRRSTCGVIPVITLTVPVEELPRIVISPPAEEEDDAARADGEGWLVGVAKNEDAAVCQENASTTAPADLVVDVDVEDEDENNKVRKHEEKAILSAPAEPVFDVDGGVEPSDNDADVHGQNTSTSSPAEPAFDLFAQLRVIAHTRAPSQTAVRTSEIFEETSLYSMLASLTPSFSSPSPSPSPSPPSSPDTEQPATPSDVDIGGEATTTPTSQSPSSAEKQTKRFKFDFDWSEDVEQEEERRNNEGLVLAWLPSREG